MDWIYLAHDMIQCRALVSLVTNLWILYKARNLLDK
jgi:hypothetical protein